MCQFGYPVRMSEGAAPKSATPVFLSHSTAGDGVVCALLADELRRHGIDPWYAHGDHGIAAGQDWEGRLRSEISRCDVMVVLASEHLHRSAWCKKEAQFASGLGKHLLVLRIDDHPLPGWVEFLGGDRQHLSLTRLPLQAAAQLLATICKDALEGNLNPGEDVVEFLELPFEVAARGHRHAQPVRRSGRTKIETVQIPPCGRDQVVRVPLGGESTLSVHVRVKPSEQFTLLGDGVSVLAVVALDATELASSEVLVVPTLDGPRQVAVPREARVPGGRVRISRGGIGRRGHAAGDLVVEFRTSGLVPGASGMHALEELQAVHDRLAIPARVVSFASPALAIVGASGFAGNGVPWTFTALIGYAVFGTWVGARYLAQQRHAAIDWVIGLAASLCFVPLGGPALLVWCGWEIRMDQRSDEWRRALVGHGTSAALAWVIMFWAWRWEPPQYVWRPAEVLAIVAAGHYLIRAEAALSPREV